MRCFTQTLARLFIFTSFRKDFLWAHSILRSRIHMVSVQDQQQRWQTAMVLIPVADMINMAASDAEACQAIYAHVCC